MDLVVAQAVLKVGAKVFTFLKPYLKKFSDENKIKLGIQEKLNELFMEAYNEGYYSYVEDISEIDLLDKVEEVYLLSTSNNIDGEIDTILNEYQFEEGKREAVKRFLIAFCGRILDVQKEYLSFEGKTVLKAIDTKQDEILRAIQGLKEEELDEKKIELLFDNFVIKGDFENLNKNREILLGVKKLNRLLLYYEMVTAYYCQKHIFYCLVEKCLKSEIDKYTNKTIEFLIEKNQAEILKKYEELVSEEIKWLYEIVTNDTFWGKLIFKSEEDANKKPPIDKKYVSLIYRLLFNKFYYSEQPLVCFAFMDKIEYPTFLQQIQILSLRVSYFEFSNLVKVEDRKAEYKKLANELKKHVDIVKALDESFRKEFFYVVLLASLDLGTYEEEYANLDEEYKSFYKIEELNYINKIKNKESNKLSEIYAFCVRNNSDKLLYIYFSSNKEVLLAEIEANKMILDFSFNVFCLYLNELYEQKQYQKYEKNLIGYSKYSTQIEYQFLRGRLEYIKEGKVNEETITEIKALLKTERVTNFTQDQFIDFCINTKQYSLLTTYDWPVSFVGIKLQLIDRLITDSNFKDKEFIEKLCTNIIEDGYNLPQIFYYRAILRYNSSKIILAIEDLKKSFEISKSKLSAIPLLRFKFIINDFTYHEAIDFCSKLCDYEAQYLVGVYYLENNKESEAYSYFLRSLLIRPEDNDSIKTFFNIMSEEEEKITSVKAGAYVNLKDVESKENREICIHHNDIYIDGMQFSRFASCEHFVEDDMQISDLLFAQKGDKVKIGENTYEVEFIKSSRSFFIGFAIKEMIRTGKAQTISASNIEEFKNNIGEILSQNVDASRERLKMYYQQQGKLPISFLSDIMGKSNLDMIHILEEDVSGKIFNNPKLLTVKASSLVLSYDAIINLHDLNLKQKDFSIDFIVPSLLSNKIISEIEQEIKDINNLSQKGSMVLIDERPTFVETSKKFRNARLKYLNSLKAFVKSLRTSGEAVESDDPKELKEVLNKIKCFSELDAVAFAKKKELPILTDEPFFYNYSDMHKVKNYGLLSLILTKETSAEIKGLLINLCNKNFANYINVNVVKRFSELVSNTSSLDEANKVLNDLFDLLVYEPVLEERKKHHRQIVIDTYRNIVIGEVLIDEVILANLKRVAINYFCQDNPEYVEKILSNLRVKVNIDESTNAIDVEIKDITEES